MTESLLPEDFKHYQNVCMKNLEIDKSHLLEAKHSYNLDPLDSDLISTLKSIIEKLSAAQHQGPEAVFKVAMEATNSVDAKRFIIENILEATKNNKNISEVMDRYAALGLIDPNAPRGNDVPRDDNNPLKGTIALLNRKSIWEKVSIGVANVAVNAFKSVPKWVEIEPQLTFVGPIPCLGFSLKGKGMSIHELFETLRDGKSDLW